MPASRNELVNKEFWDKRHRTQAKISLYPRPDVYYLDYELDLIFRKYLAGKSGRTILEAGCGSSVWLPYFSKEFGLKIYGIDYSEVGLELSRRILQRNKVAGKLILGDFMTVKDDLREAFDFVFALGVIEHFTQPLMVMEKLKSFLKPGGRLILWVPNLAGWILRLNHIFNPHRENFYGDLGPDKLMALHRELNLGIVEARFTQFLDLMLVNLTKLPSFLEKGLARFFRAMGLFFIFTGKFLQLRPRFKPLCSGFIVVSEKKTV